MLYPVAYRETEESDLDGMATQHDLLISRPTSSCHRYVFESHVYTVLKKAATTRTVQTPTASFGVASPKAFGTHGAVDLVV